MWVIKPMELGVTGVEGKTQGKKSADGDPGGCAGAGRPREVFSDVRTQVGWRQGAGSVCYRQPEQEGAGAAGEQ